MHPTHCCFHHKHPRERYVEHRKSCLSDLALLDPLDGMQQHTRQTHASTYHRLFRVSVVAATDLDTLAALAVFFLLAADNLFRLAPLVNLDLPAQPSPVDVLGEARAEVPRPTVVVVFAVAVVGRVRALRPTNRVEVTVQIGVEDGIDVVRRPNAVKPNGLRRIDSLETVLKGDSRRPHFSLHAATNLVLNVHRVQHALAETCDRVDENTARNGDETGVRVGVVVRVNTEIRVEARNVVPNLVAVRPESANRVEHGQKSDEVCLLTNTPFVVVGSHLVRRHRSNRSLHGRVGLRAPDRARNRT